MKTIPFCRDAAKLLADNVTLSSLGRIVCIDVSVKNVCPQKEVSLSILLEEEYEDKSLHPVGSRHILIPAHSDTVCRDINLKGIAFSIPEALGENKNDLSSKRTFKAKIIANYVNSDTSFLNEEEVTL